MPERRIDETSDIRKGYNEKNIAFSYELHRNATNKSHSSFASSCERRDTLSVCHGSLAGSLN
jgi:hypothetical protein